MTDTPAIFWFRDDLRLGDNPGLAAAIATNQPLILVYIYDDVSPGLRPLGGATKWWLDKSLKSLAGAIDKMGQELVFARGAAFDVLTSLVAETGASQVFWNRRYGGAERAIDAQIKTTLNALDVRVESFNASLLMEPWRLKTGQGGPYRAFSPMWKALEAAYDEAPPLPAPDKLPGGPSLSLDALENWDLHPTTPDWSAGIAAEWTPGEDNARDTLETFLDGAIRDYSDGRNLPARRFTSRLSPHLRFGEVSPRQIWTAAKLAQERVGAPAADTHKFLSEIAWREFSYSLLFHSPGLAQDNWNSNFDALPWRYDADDLEAWRRGRTGYPIVDAGMRELWTTGWMHNRVRMIVASFLTKHLLIDWRHGEDWFWDTLVDADPANNPASWQWTAGSGADAAPYFRIFNPVSQGEKFDPTGEYVRRWAPELASLPDQFIHRPWDASPLILKAAGVELGETYPNPIIGLAEGRARALAAYDAVKTRKAAA